MISRRSALSGLLAGACVPMLSRNIALAAQPSPAAPLGNEMGWNKQWDEQLLAGLLKQMNQAYDPAAQMSSAYHGPDYSYQSALRNTTVHPIRDTFE